MEDIVQIPVPLPHIRLGQHLAAAGDAADARGHRSRATTRRSPRSSRASAAPASALEDLELVLITHHHLDHSGLAATIAARSGAQIGALDRAADYGERYEERSDADRRFSLALMRHHGVPDARDRGQRGRSGTSSATPRTPTRTDHRLSDGDAIRAGGRDLRVVARPGHSTTDTLFVDERRRPGLRRRPPARRRLLQHRGLPGRRAGRDAPARARRVPREPAPDGRDAARRAC